jgi:hypothetical protein
MDVKNNKLPDKSKDKAKAPDYSPEYKIYKAMIESSIREYCSVTSPELVMKLANEIYGMEMDKRGNVKRGANLENFIALVKKIRWVFGPVAYLLTKKAISGIVTEGIKRKLPDELG